MTLLRFVPHLIKQKHMMKNLQMLLLIGVSSCMAILAGNEGHINLANDDNNITALNDIGVVKQVARIIRGPKTEEMASKGSNVSIKCEVESSPQYEIRWEFNNTEIIEGKKYMVNQNNGNLMVRKVGPHDQGTYRCTVKKDGDVKDFKEGKLVVKSETTIVYGPEDTAVGVWNMVRMNCTVLYYMEEDLTVTWMKDGRQLGGVEYQEEDVSFGRNTHYGLMLGNVTMDDAGNYTCWARTNSSEDRITGKLEVFGIPPTLSKMEALEAMEEDNVIIECTLKEGYPAPTVSWYIDNVALKGEQFELQEDNSLLIKKANVENSAVYKCVAKNDAGEGTEEVRVDIRSKTIIENKANSFVYNEGGEVIIDCEVTADPNLERYLSVSWYQGEAELINLPNLQPVFTGGVEAPELNVFQMYDEGSGFGGSENREDYERVVLMANNSLKIFKMKEGDVGEYTCKAKIDKDGYKELVVGETNKIYVESLFPWWIIVIVFLNIVIVVIICTVVICRLRKGLIMKGNYDVHDIEGTIKKVKKTDIYYLPRDLDYESFINACTPTPGQTPCCGIKNTQPQFNQTTNKYNHMIWRPETLNGLCH